MVILTLAAHLVVIVIAFGFTAYLINKAEEWWYK